LDRPTYEIISLNHSYADKTVLEIEHLSVEQANIIGLIGPNGSGKSTLLKLLGLIEKPSRGTIKFNGRYVEPFSDEARFLITLLPQEPFLMRRSVFNNVAYGLKLRGDRRDVVARVDEALSLVGLESKEFARRPWYALSGGESQRVALAARLVLRPKVLLLDEPTASVDVTSAQLIKEASIRVRNEFGTTLVVASHDWQWLYEICDSILHLFKGRIFGTGRETVIFGPWQKLGVGKWGKMLSDKQQLNVSEPPGPEAAAVIEASWVSQEAPPVADQDVVLKGTVSRLSLERKTGHVFATILAGDLPFTVKLMPEQKKGGIIFPGETIFVRYSLNQIRWI
jgi:tungstate transport system ATP-binding protein